jgi:hypothetical protein
MRIVQALNSLLADPKTLAQDTVTAGTVAQRRRREELANDVFGWFVPRVLRSLRAIPMQQVEFQNDALDLAVEALLLEATGPPLEASLVPDRLIVQNWSELRLEPVPKVYCGRHNDGVAALDVLECFSSTSVRIHVEGMRVSARGIGYYVRYKPLGCEDQGLLSADVGGQGVAVDIVPMTTSSTGARFQKRQGSRYSVWPDVNVAVKGLTVPIDRRKRWIVNKVIVQPLLAPLGRWIVRKMLVREGESQIFYL